MCDSKVVFYIWQKINSNSQNLFENFFCSLLHFGPYKYTNTLTNKHPPLCNVSAKDGDS